MSERSDLQQHGEIFAAQRRSGHWCEAVTPMVSPLYDSMVHQ